MSSISGGSVLDTAKEVTFARGVIRTRVRGLRRRVAFHPCDQCLRTMKREHVALRGADTTVGEDGFSVPVDSKEKGRGERQGRCQRGTPFTYFSDCSSTQVKEWPTGLASIVPMALASTKARS